VFRLSIIIPCLETDGRLDDTLASVLQNRPEACEVIVVHRGRYDDPYDLAGEVVFHEAAGDEGLVGLLNHGLELAQGPIVHLLQCGSEVEEGWTDRALQRFDDKHVAAVSPLVFAPPVARRERADAAACVGVAAARFGGSRPVVQLGDGPLRPRPLGPSLVAAFYRTESLRSIGGFAPCVGAELADLDAALALAAKNLQCVVEPSSRVTACGESQQFGDVFSAGQAAERLFWRHVFRPRGGGLGAVLAHPLSLVLDLLVRLPRGGAFRRAAGRVAVLAEAGCHARFGRSLISAPSPEKTVEGTSRRVDRPHVNQRTVGRNAKTLTP
jgi:hypothetical protein